MQGYNVKYVFSGIVSYQNWMLYVGLYVSWLFKKYAVQASLINRSPIVNWVYIYFCNFCTSCLETS